MHIQNRLGLIESTETMLAQGQRLNQISNNLANVDTPGYKKEDITFWEMLYTTNEDRDRVGKALNIHTNQEEGPVKATGNKLDFAIAGEGLFKLQTPQGVRYSRAGNFLVNSQNQLVNPNGYQVLGAGGPITINGKDVSVSSDGKIMVDNIAADQFDIVTFADMQSIEKEGKNLFRTIGEEGEEIQALNFSVKQGFIESSNVSLVPEMTNMLDLHRAYETQQKIIRTFDEMDGRAINTVGKLT